jgi:hypothetical protein
MTFSPRPIDVCAGIYPAMEYIYSLAVVCYKFRKLIEAMSECARARGTSYNREISQLMQSKPRLLASTANLDLLVDHWDGRIEVLRAVEFH